METWHRYKWIFKLVLICSFILIFISILQKVSLQPISSYSETSSTATSNTDKQVVTLNYYIWDDEESYIKPVIDAYTSQHPNIHIQLHSIDSNQYEKDILSILNTSPNQVDLLGLRGISKVLEFKNEGFLYDLTPELFSSNLDMTAYGSMFNEIALDGQYYGIPTRSTSWMLFYNKSLFDQAGIPYPSQMTWDNYRSLAIELTDLSSDSSIYGGYWVPWCYNFGALQRGSYLIDDDLSYTKDSIKRLNEFYNIDGSHMSYAQLTDNNINIRTEFEKGTIAMMPQGEWMINMLLDDTKSGLTNVDWDIAPMPNFPGQDSNTTWGQYQFVSISSTCCHFEEAFDFVSFLCGKEGASIYADNGIVHAYQDSEIREAYLKTVNKPSASMIFSAKRIQEEPAYLGYDAIHEAFNQEMQTYFLGNETLDDAFNHFIVSRQNIINDYQ